MTPQPERMSPITLAFVVVVGFALPMLCFGVIYIVATHVQEQTGDMPPANYWSVYTVDGPRMSLEKIENNTFYQEHARPGTLKLNHTGSPGCSAEPITYVYTFQDLNSTEHTAYVFVGQDGTWASNATID